MSARTTYPLMRPFYALALAVLLAGCSAPALVAGSGPRVDYDPAANVTTYSAFPSFPTSRRPPVGAAVAHDVRAFYACPSYATCTPEFVRVALVRTGRDESVLRVRAVTVIAGGQTREYDADGLGATGAVPGPVVTGALVWTMPLNDFERLATAETARFRVGDLDLDVPWDRREPLRGLAAVARQQVPGDSARSAQ